MRKRNLLLGLMCLSLSGCQLNISYDKVDLTQAETTTAADTTTEAETESDTEAVTETEEKASEIIMTLPSEAQSEIESVSKAARDEISIDSIPDMYLPKNEKGEWSNHVLLVRDLFHHVYETSDKADFGENGVVYDIKNYPLIAVGEDLNKQKEFNDKIVQYLYNNFNRRFQMYNIAFELECFAHNKDSRFISFEIAGDVFHNGDDSRYQDEKEYRFYFTIDRMTLDKIALGTAYGVDRAVEDIKNGNYTVVKAEDSVFEAFSDELLARVFRDDPMFSDDPDHYLDFYFDAGKVCVCIWVGNDHGGYAVLKLNGDSELLARKDKSVLPETMEAEQEDTTEETT